MSPIFGPPLTGALEAYVSGVAPTPLALPLVWGTVLVWAMVAVLLASVAAILGAGERRQAEGGAAVHVRRPATMPCYACCR